MNAQRGTAVGEGLDFAWFSDHDWEIWHVAYVAGYLEGAAVQQAEDFAPIDEAARATVRRTASSPDYAELCERRGQHARADGIRKFWEHTGLTNHHEPLPHRRSA